METKISRISSSVTLDPTRYSSLRKQRKRLHVLVIGSILFLSSVCNVVAQGRVVLNGAKINLTGNAYLVVANPATNAITRNSGHIISEGQTNNIKWNIGTTTGTYVIPWGYGDAEYIPVTFTKTAGSGTGYFLFSTYKTAWNNSALLPTGVTNINCACGFDNSTFETDRFWQINAQGYTTKPSLTNVEFTYLDAENATPNTIMESGIRVKRYNSTSNSWTDVYLSNSLNSTTNKLTVASIDVANLYSWWTLGTLNGNRYWVAPSNSNSNLAANWAPISGGAGNAGVPVMGDAVFFDTASNSNCVLDSDLSAYNLTISPGFAGTITQGNNAITVNNDATFSGGAFTGGTGNITVNGNFTVAGTSFTAPSNYLEIKGNFNMTSGSFTHNNGTVVFSGTNGTTQTINTSTATTFNNISVTNTAASPGVSVQSNENLKGVLTLASNVNFDADGSANTAIFKLLSTADSPTQDASIATLPSGAQVSGKVTVQRFMTKEGANNGRIYRYISSPILNATVADLQQEIPVTGTFTGRSSCSGCTSSSQSLFAYNETVITDTNGSGANDQEDGYIDFPNATNSETFQSGRGYALYVRANLLTSTLWDLRGTINSGNISFPVTYTSTGTLGSDGWNLVGNPFPSTIDWNSASGWTKTNMETAIYITDNGSAATIRTAAWNGIVGTNGGSRYVSTGQAFWVKANGAGAPVLQADENVKVAGTQTTFFREIQPSTLLRVTLAQGAIKDETIIHFREDASSDFDPHADARKLPNSIVNISSVLPDGKTLAINSLGTFDCNTTIPLTINNVAPGNYKLDFAQLETFPTGINILLEDNFTGASVDIRSGSYNFQVTASKDTYGSNRFKISFSSVQLNPALSINAADVCEGTDGLIWINNVQEGVSYQAQANDITLASSKQNGIMTIIVPKTYLKSGENKLTIQSSTAFCDEKMDQEIVLNVQSLQTPTVESATTCEPGAVTLKASGASDNDSYNWYEEQNSAIPIEEVHGDTFKTPSLKKSKTFYVSITNGLGCESERVPVKASIMTPEPAVIQVMSNTLASNYLVGNQWHLNGEKLEGATEQTIQAKESGIYMLEVTTQGCTTSSQVDFTIPVNEEEEIPTPGEEVTPSPQDDTEGQTSKEETVTGAEEVSFYNIISISPNPFKGTAIIQVSNTFQNVTKVRVMNSAGQILQYVTLEQAEGKKIGYIKLENQPSGVYLIQIFSTTGVHQRKIVKK
jgi:hypothetical protein